jgi:predicted signal transduction protein with EAL and GGDEF domain
MMTEGPTKLARLSEKKPQRQKKKAVKKEELGGDEFIVKEISPQMRENLSFVLKADFTIDELRAFKRLSDKRRSVIKFLEEIGPEGVAAIAQMADDEELIKTGKLKLLSAVNELSRKEPLRKAFLRIDSIIQNVKKVRERLH